MRRKIGIDIGSVNTRICTAADGVILNEPTVVAVDVDSDEILEAGSVAIELQKERPDQVKLIYPVWSHFVKAPELLGEMLRYFLRRAVGRRLLRPRVMLAIPCDLTEAQINAMEDAALSAGAAFVHMLEAPLCAALGTGFDFSVPTGQLLVHIGASRTEAAMIFLGDMVVHVSTPIGGKAFDNAIIQYLRKVHALQITGRTAEQIKLRIGNLIPTEEKKLEVRGRSVADNTPRTITLQEHEILLALRDVMSQVMDTILSVVERTGTDMKADISKTGIMLTGGAVLKNTDQFLADIVGVRAKCAGNADTAVVEGAVIALERLGK